ncbi:tRNA pseudouridine(38-40) synthase TruA [Oceanobacillus arenosus]|uniref:tRNA pseudouridine synthase A n=1 Tax=Oceanobacillus arenosus TaxID=1229153 RepID=A0A3D8Q1F4_9BACI|nr:tRNA pseudouridine(38-40) synthase TruA [Oceanobacillus arenosus]RDW21862.1 tRNA pseudouridine(38-40) synthase TruA [Oceanobacillus arenosus]
MGRLKCTINYDGSGFFGFQFQPTKRTVQGELEKVLKQIHKGDRVRLQASGRTDAGVHAKGQVIHFDSPYDIPELGWKRAMNTLLPEDIYIDKVEGVTDAFHARYSAMEKEYHYFVWNAEEPDVFKRNYAYYFPYRLDIDKIQEACRYLEGTHDFTTFSSAKATTKGSKIRTIYQATCKQSGAEMEFIFRGSGFLYNMVRIMVSVLLDIGQGRRNPADIKSLLDGKNRQLAGKTIAPQGLYLWQVKYDK